MRKISTKNVQKKLLITFLLGSLFFSFLLAPTITYRLKKFSLYQPWVLWTDAPNQKVLISWTSAAEDQVEGIVYGTNSTNLIFTKFSSSFGVIRHLNLSELESNTMYYYQLINSEQNLLTTNQFSFKTAPDPLNGTATFIAISDTQQMLGPGYHYQVASAIGNYESEVDLILHAGDLVGNFALETDWNSFFETGAPYLSKSAFAPTFGNHDGGYQYPEGISNSDTFLDYFPYTSDNINNQIYYSLNFSYLHIAVLSFPYGNPQEFTQQQINWLEDDLHNSAIFPFKIVMFHCPIYSSGFYGGNPNMVQLHTIFKANNVSLVFSGHDHHYERIIKDDITYIILGSGGAIQDPHEKVIEDSEFIAFGPSYVRGQVNSTSLQLLTFRTDHSILDRCVIQNLYLGGEL